MKIRTKLFASILACGLVPMGVLGTINFFNSQSAFHHITQESVNGMTNLANSKLTAVAEVKKAQIKDYFESASRQITSIAHSTQSSLAIRSFAQGFKSFTNDRKLVNENEIVDLPQVKQYYQTIFSAEYLKNNPGKSVESDIRVSQLSPAGLALQNAYIVQNANPLGNKQQLIESPYKSKYDAAHKANHPFFKYVLEQYGYYDIFLIDSESGDIVYTVFKEVDFATNLNDGPYARTALGDAFRKANSQSASDAPVLVDFARYYPSYESPASFIAAPIFDGEKRIGVVAIQMPIDKVNSVMNVGSYLGDDGEAYLVAKDFLPRSDSKLDTANRTIVQAFRDPAKGQIKTEAVERALRGETGLLKTKNYLGQETLTGFSPINVFGLEWAIITDEPVSTALASAEEIATGSSKAQSSLLFWFLGLTIGSVAVILPFSLLIVRNLMTPIRATINTLRDIAEGEGDLTRRLDASRADELGELSKWFNAFAQRIHDVVCTVSDNSNSLSASSTQLSQTAESLSAGVSSSKQQSASVSAAAEEMSVNMRQVADSTDGMSQTIRAVAASVEEMNQTIREIARNAEKSAAVAGQAATLVEVSNEKISTLGNSANEIGRVIEVIQDIAEQTNLLALNATIEAARAGEAGKGFAVVATEVKELAKQTAAATDDIRSRIEAIQASTTDAVESIREISEVINNVNEVSRTIASAVEEQSITTRQISDNVSTTANAAETVARGVSETAVASREITENITKVDSVLLQTAEGADESRNAGIRLSELASEMTEMIGKFRTDRTKSSNLVRH
jgi:methyl-accepting chemotaxis protein